MSEKKLHRILTSAAVATALFLTAAAEGSAAQPHNRGTQVRGVQFVAKPGDSRPFLLWRLLVGVWEKSGPSLDPEGVMLRFYADSEAPTSENGSDVDQGGR
jgi:hypothetical protein